MIPTYRQSDIERARAQAFSAAADTACNNWNLLRRTKEWRAMAGHFQTIWKGLKDISSDYHKLADELQADEQIAVLQAQEAAEAGDAVAAREAELRAEVERLRTVLRVAQQIVSTVEGPWASVREIELKQAVEAAEEAKDA